MFPLPSVEGACGAVVPPLSVEGACGVVFPLPSVEGVCGVVVSSLLLLSVRFTQVEAETP